MSWSLVDNCGETVKIADDLVLDHIGIAVRSLAEGIDHWERVFGYRVTSDAVENTRQKVKVVFLGKEGSTDIKLIAPADETSPLQGFVRRGGGVHHLCFRCADLDSGVAQLQALGLRLLVPPQPGEAFDNNSIAFLFSQQGINIELIDSDRRVGGARGARGCQDNGFEGARAGSDL